jgi:hypothetical protein
VIGLDSNNKFFATLYKDSDSTSGQTHTSTTTVVSKDTWYYVLVTVALKADTKKDSTITVYVNNASEGSSEAVDIFNVNLSTYITTIGCERLQLVTDPDDDDTDSQTVRRWNGYVYDLHIYQRIVADS